MIAAIQQPEFLPWLGLIDKIRQSDVLVLLDCVQYERRYFQNRNRIRSKDGVLWLTVPVSTKGRFDQRIQDVEIEEDRRWKRKHLLSIQASYARALYYQQYFPGLEKIYAQTWGRLVDLDTAVLNWCLDAFGLQCRVIHASTLDVKGRRSELLANICHAIGAHIYISGPAGRDYIDGSCFANAGIEVRYHEFNHPSYRQQFEPFMPLMSSIDLLLNEGPGSLAILDAANPHEVSAVPR